MNIDTVKIEIIDWITGLNDPQLIKKILSLKSEKSADKVFTKRIFGSGKHLIDFISDDFNEPIDVFKDYEK
jgi:hypothetical protein